MLDLFSLPVVVVVVLGVGHLSPVVVVVVLGAGHLSPVVVVVVLGAGHLSPVSLPYAEEEEEEGVSHTIDHWLSIPRLYIIYIREGEVLTFKLVIA